MLLFHCKAIKKQYCGYRMAVYIICLIASLGGLLFGLAQGFIANSLDTIKEVYNLDMVNGERYSSILALGGIIGVLFSGMLARALGRKKNLVLVGFIFSISSLVSMFLPPINILNACRFFLGFGAGISSFMIPLYLSEITPAAIRGSMGALFLLMFTLGIFLISLMNVFIARVLVDTSLALSVMFLVIVIFSFLVFIGNLVLPESPRWLMLKGKRSRAVSTLNKIFNTKKEVDFEILEIEKALSNTKKAGMAIIFKGYFFKVLLIGIFLQIFQQLAGINVMIYYAPTIFGYIGMKGLIAMLIVPTVNVIFTIPAIYLVEKWGRKKLLHVGAFFMLIAMIAVGLVFQGVESFPNTFMIGKTIEITLLIAVIVYIFGFAVAWGPVVCILCSEIFPLRYREIGMTITTMVNWIFVGVVTRYSLSFMEIFGRPSLFYLFAGFCMLAIFFVALFVPETKGISLEVIESKIGGEK